MSDSIRDLIHRFARVRVLASKGKGKYLKKLPLYLEQSEIREERKEERMSVKREKERERERE